MRQTLFLAGILIIVMSCRPYPREVEEALALSGDNRNELERVLNHFRQKDMQEFEAACFLIANMQYHQSKEEIIPDAAYSIISEKRIRFMKLFFPIFPFLKCVLSGMGNMIR